MSDTGTPTLDQLHVLTTVVEAGSFSAAARRLHRAQSVISYTIANLEAQLGVALFARDGRRPVLTEAGVALIADARRVGRMVDEMRARAAALRQGLEAELGLAVDVMFPTARLVAALDAFARAYPTVGLRLRIEGLGGVARLVLDRSCQLGVSGWMGEVPDMLERRAIGEVRLIPVAAPTHPVAGTQAHPATARGACADTARGTCADANRQRGVARARAACADRPDRDDRGAGFRCAGAAHLATGRPGRQTCAAAGGPRMGQHAGGDGAGRPGRRPAGAAAGRRRTGTPLPDQPDPPHRFAARPGGRMAGGTIGSRVMQLAELTPRAADGMAARSRGGMPAGLSDEAPNGEDRTRLETCLRCLQHAIL
jgi:DNA-binding transcriptional LysR family regulator